MNIVKVIVADDNPVVRSGLVALLESTGEVEVIAEAANGEQAIAQTERFRPDLVLLDVRMPLVDGITALGPISRLTKVLMLTYTDDPEVIRRYLELHRERLEERFADQRRTIGHLMQVITPTTRDRRRSARRKRGGMRLVSLTSDEATG